MASNGEPNSGGAEVVPSVEAVEAWKEAAEKAQRMAEDARCERDALAEGLAQLSGGALADQQWVVASNGEPNPGGAGVVPGPSVNAWKEAAEKAQRMAEDAQGERDAVAVRLAQLLGDSSPFAQLRNLAPPFPGGGPGAAPRVAPRRVYLSPSIWWWVSPPAVGGGDRSGAGGRVFRKAMPWSCRADWTSVTTVYERLGADHAAGTRAALPPPLVGGVRLIRGAHVVVLETDALVGCEPCTDEEVVSPGPVMDAAAEGIALLAVRYGLLYTDLRGPNVMRPHAAPGAGTGGGAAGEGPAAWLVDYDDCVPLKPLKEGGWPVSDLDSYRDHLEGTEAAKESNTFASFFCCGTLPDVEEALEAAFHRVRLSGAGAVG